MTKYPLERVGGLLLTKAAVSGPAGVKVLWLLVDTGSVYTILPVEVLELTFRTPRMAIYVFSRGILRTHSQPQAWYVGIA
jgi:hypothetical protein